MPALGEQQSECKSRILIHFISIAAFFFFFCKERRSRAFYSKAFYSRAAPHEKEIKTKIKTGIEYNYLKLNVRFKKKKKKTHSEFE